MIYHVCLVSNVFYHDMAALFNTKIHSTSRGAFFMRKCMHNAHTVCKPQVHNGALHTDTERAPLSHSYQWQHSGGHGGIYQKIKNLALQIAPKVI